MKKCPFCTWEIPEEAVKCKHCWEFIQDKYKKTQTLVKRGMFEWSKMIFCSECHYEGETKKYERSWSSAVWCLLYLFFFIPGLIYEAYRGNNYFVCPKCRNKHIKALESNEKQNKWKTWCLRALGILFWLPMLIGMLWAILSDGEYTPTDSAWTVSVESSSKSNEYSSLEDAYHAHKNYIWHVCKEGVKVLNPESKNFDGPTYAGEYRGEFIIKGTSSGIGFRCVFVPEHNERGMNLKDVTRQF